MKLVLFLIFITFIESPFCQTIVTEAPSVSASAVTIPKHSLQLETGVKINRSLNPSDNYEYAQLSIPYALMRWGITKKIELRMTGRVDKGITSGNVSGLDVTEFNELGLEAKFQLLNKPEGKTKIGLISRYILYQEGNTFKAGSITMALSYSFNEKHSLGFNIGIRRDLIKDEEYNYISTTHFLREQIALFSSLIYSIQINEKICLFSELFGQISNSAVKYDWGTNRDPFSLSFIGGDIGLLYLIRKNMQIDYNIGFLGEAYFGIYNSLGLNILLNSKK